MSDFDDLQLTRAEEEAIGREITSILKVSHADLRVFALYEEIIEALFDVEQFEDFKAYAEATAKSTTNYEYEESGLKDNVYNFVLDHVKSDAYNELLKLVKEGVVSIYSDSQPLQA